MTQKPSAEAVARYLLHLSAQGEEPALVTHMMLQKLMYYVQGWSLGTGRGEMFEGAFEAWQHGPVAPALYQQFKRFGDNPIPPGEGRAAPELDDNQRHLIEWVWERYSKYSAPHLRHLTHTERPWQEARADLPEGARSEAPIAPATMAAFFEAQYRKELARRGMDLDDLRISLEQVRRGEVVPLESIMERRR
jgi:uncharacterized phage-associated protein